MLTKFYQATILLLLLLVTSASWAQNWQWVATPTITSTGIMTINGTGLDASGNVIIAGEFNGSITLGNITLTTLNSSDIDVFVAKLSSAGVWTQAVRAGGAGIDLIYGMTVDGTGSAVVTGPFRGPTATFGNITLANADYTGTTDDVFVARLNSGGTWTQAVRAGGSGNDLGNRVAVDAAGNVAVVGVVGAFPATFGTTVLPGGPGLFVAKLATSGTWTQAVKAGSTDGDGAYGLSIAANGDTWVTGTFFSPRIDFGATSLVNSDPSGTTGDAFIGCLNTAGVWTQAIKFGGLNTETGIGINIDANGTVATTGTFRSSSLAFGSTTLTNAGTTGTSDIYVAQYAGNGVWARATRAGGPYNDVPFGFSVDAGGNTLLAGSFRGPTASFGNFSLVNVDGSGTTSDVFVATLTANYTWAQALRAGGNGTSLNEACLSLAPTGNGGAIIAGILDGTATFGSATTPNVRGLGFVARLDGLTLATKHSVSETIGLVPNPAHANATFALPAATNNRSVQVVDALGRTARTYHLPAHAPTATLDLAGLAPGLYVVRCGAASGKLVVE